ncbi:mitochondrial assembly of ribosomal large subunit protein 1 [Xyrichtys novacula]|uniref:Mitochondrial assembly of ribosomal large subunit protein 1 n=1 Tax=Xyrichtys novacula TaxID=13765 RepID=A0AAV1FKU6_XYRNO|nr:mitochondrial assembly of ribosomal large subunit protein 1 [Xyrichtys novacula]
MSFFCRSKILLPSAFRINTLLEHTRCLKSFSSASRALYNSQCQSRRFTPCLSFCPFWHHSRHFDKRLYSELCGENSINKSNSLVQEELTETDNDYKDSRQRSPQSFTLDTLVSLLRQENAVDICVIKVPEQIKYTDYFIVVSGMSPRHLRAMALYAIKVYKFLKKEDDPHVKIEGKNAEDWICIDFGPIVCHFMLPESREVYELEKLWTLRNYDEQLKSMPAETLPEDYIYDAEKT